MAQWVKNLTAVAPVATEVRFQSLAWCSGLKIQHCRSCDLSHWRSSDSVTGPGTSICRGSSPRKRQKKIQKNPKQNKYISRRDSVSQSFVLLVIIVFFWVCGLSFNCVYGVLSPVVLYFVVTHSISPLFCWMCFLWLVYENFPHVEVTNLFCNIFL